MFLSTVRRARAARFLLLSLFLHPTWAQAEEAPANTLAEASVPYMPGCVCSEGGEIRYPEASTGKVFISNCLCGAQACAVSWGKSLAIDCAAGASLPPATPDFTKLPVGDTKKSELKVGGFSVSLTADPPLNTIRIGNVEQGPPPYDKGMTPNYIRFADGDLELTYPILYRRAVIDWVSGIGKPGEDVTFQVQTGQNVTRRHVVKNPQQTVPTPITIEIPEGIKKVRLPAIEGGVFELCAYEFAVTSDPDARLLR